jgi:hypothetical protein
MKYKEVIPKCFWHDSEPTPVAETVGDLIEQLQRLPPDLEVRAGWYAGAALVVFNIDRDNMHLEICEVD